MITKDELNTQVEIKNINTFLKCGCRNPNIKYANKDAYCLNCKKYI